MWHPEWDPGTQKRTLRKKLWNSESSIDLVVTYQHWNTNYDKCTTLMEDVNKGNWVWDRQELSVLSSQSFSKSKLC